VSGVSDGGVNGECMGNVWGVNGEWSECMDLVEEAGRSPSSVPSFSHSLDHSIHPHLFPIHSLLIPSPYVLPIPHVIPIHSPLHSLPTPLTPHSLLHLQVEEEPYQFPHSSLFIHSHHHSLPIHSPFPPISLPIPFTPIHCLIACVSWSSLVVCEVSC
jgi:hypothetical protein